MTKKFQIVILQIVGVLLGVQTANASYGGGSGTSSDPYLIMTPEHLIQLGQTPSDYDKSFKMMTDVDLSQYAFDRAVIAPDTDDALSGFQGTIFTGRFDGNGYAIVNLTITNNMPSSYLGLFGSTENAQVINVNLENVSITAAGTGSYCLGAIAGYQNAGLMTGCTVSGLISGDYFVGGLVGYCAGTIFNSCASGHVSGFSTLGGFVGCCDGIIGNCESNATLTAVDRSSAVGGFAGVYSSGSISKCSSFGFVYCGDMVSDIGGFSGDGRAPLESCFSFVNVAAGRLSSNIGGMVGSVYGSVLNCYTRGSIQVGSESINIGGFVGWSNGHIENCYSTGLVQVGTSSCFAGGLIGNALGQVISSYWDIDSSNQLDGSAGTGLTTVQMKQKDSYQEWDFDSAIIDGDAPDWNMLREGVTYPLLAWQDLFPGDIQGDYGVDADDFEKMLGNWLADCELLDCGNTDITQDQKVDLTDFASLSRDWLKQELRSENISVTTQPQVQEELVFTSLPELVPDTMADSYGVTNAAETNNYIWGFSVASQKLYKKSKVSGDWTHVPESGPVTIAWADNSHWLIVFNGLSSGKFSVDEGVTWNAITAMPVPTDGGGAFSANWSMAFSDTAAVLVEYDSSMSGTPPILSNGRKIYRSADWGQNWQTVKDVQDHELNDPNTSFHFHSVGYHAASGTFMASVGGTGSSGQEVTSNRCFYRSTDNGATWQKWLSEAGMQPIQIADYGDPTRVLCGSDMYGGAYSLDLQTEYATPLLYNRLTQTQNGQGFVWIVKRCNGIIYAFQYDGSVSSLKWPKVWVSSEGEKWGTYYQFDQKDSGNGARNISGVAQGYVHITMSNKKNFMLKEARLSKENCVLLVPQFTNLLNTDNKSHFTENSLAWTSAGSNYGVTRENEGLFGEHSLRLSKAEPNVPAFGSLVTDLNQATLKRNGRNYIGRVWVKGDAGDVGGAVRIKGSSGESVASYFWTKNPDQWLDVMTLPDNLNAEGSLDSNGRLIVYIGGEMSQVSAGSDFDIFLGGAVIGSKPSDFVPGSSPRSSTRLIYFRVAKNTWTSFLTVCPDAAYQNLKDYYDPWSSSATYDKDDFACYHSGQAGSGKTYRSLKDGNKAKSPPMYGEYWAEVSCPKELPRYHIKTWDMGLGNKLVLYVDCCPYYAYNWGSEIQGRKFKVDIYIDGNVVETLQQAAPCVWDRRSQFNFAVSVGSDVRFYINHVGIAYPEEIVSSSLAVSSGLMKGYMKNTVITHQYGDSVYDSLIFYTPFPNDKDFDSAMNNETGAVIQEMNRLE